MGTVEKARNAASSKTEGNTRFDARLPKKQKELFEYAAVLAGFKSLSEFVVSSVQQRAEAIILTHNTILASERDKKTFFNAIMNPGEPNADLRDAAELYKKAMNNK